MSKINHRGCSRLRSLDQIQECCLTVVIALEATQCVYKFHVCDLMIPTMTTSTKVLTRKRKSKNMQKNLLYQAIMEQLMKTAPIWNVFINCSANTILINTDFPPWFPGYKALLLTTINRIYVNFSIITTPYEQVFSQKY